MAVHGMATVAGDCLVDRNAAVNSGGALTTDGGIVRIDSSAWIDNVAGTAGGGFMATGGAVLTVINSSLVHNSVLGGEVEGS